MPSPLEEIRAQLDRIEGLLRDLAAGGARSVSSPPPSSKDARDGSLRSARHLVDNLLQTMSSIDAADYLRSKFSADPEQLAAALTALGPIPSSSEDRGGEGASVDAARAALRRAAP